MRRVASCFFVLLVASAYSPARAQMDEKPPVLKRNDPTNPQLGGQSKESKSSTSDSSKDDSDLVSATGIIRHIDDKTITVEAEDTRFLTCKITSFTKLSGPEGKLTADDFDPGMRVKLLAKYSENREQLNATSITLENATDRPKDAKTATVEGPPDEEGRPILRRGIPPKRKSSDDDDGDTVASAKEPSANATSGAVATESVEPQTKLKVRSATESQDALIEKSRGVTAEFSSKLPNFVGQQFTTRYTRESRATGWVAQDIISATVVYVDGKEDYQNIKIGNKPGPKDMMDTKGQTSTGDFNSTLESLMERGRGAEFHFVKDAVVKQLRTKVYDFAVPRERSDWQIKVQGQSLLPAYSGRVWIDRDSGRIVRIERQADKIPDAFPMDTVEQTVDYDFVLLGNRKVLLPGESENLSCERGSSFCAKNVIEFRNYREFRGEATIVDFDK
jgi:hypothetical protein